MSGRTEQLPADQKCGNCKLKAVKCDRENSAQRAVGVTRQLGTDHTSRLWVVSVWLLNMLLRGESIFTDMPDNIYQGSKQKHPFRRIVAKKEK